MHKCKSIMMGSYVGNRVTKPVVLLIKFNFNCGVTFALGVEDFHILGKKLLPSI